MATYATVRTLRADIRWISMRTWRVLNPAVSFGIWSVNKVLFLLLNGLAFYRVIWNVMGIPNPPIPGIIIGHEITFNVFGGQWDTFWFRMINLWGPLDPVIGIATMVVCLIAEHASIHVMWRDKEAGKPDSAAAFAIFYAALLIRLWTMIFFAWKF